MYGNVNVDYTPCKTVSQLQTACDYILGRTPDQIKNGIVKTRSDLYFAFDNDRDNFANEVLLTRKLFGKKANGKGNLAFKMSISFHPEDNVTPEQAFRISKEFAEKFFHKKGYDVLFAVHIDRDHIHTHFIVGNVNRVTGKAFRRDRRDLYEMSEYFGEQCKRANFRNSVRENFYSDQTVKETFAERQMTKKGKETFKAELREAIDSEIADPNNRTFEDVISALKNHYNVECRVAGNTVSYRHPEYKDKNGQLVSVRGSKLGKRYTKGGIEDVIKESGRAFFQNADRTLRRAFDKPCVYADGEGGRGGEGQRSGDIDSGGNGAVQDTAGLFAGYAQKVRRAERESAETHKPAKRVRKKRSDINI